MTCEELRLSFGEHCCDDQLGSEGNVIVRHLATCAHCARFVEEQKELASSLRMVRELTGGVSESLDTAVLRNYRQHLAERRSQPTPTRSRWLSPGLRWAWVAVAAVFLVGVVWLFSARRPVTVSTVPAKAEPSETASATKSATPTPAEPVVAEAKRRPTKAPRRAPSYSVGTRTPLPVRAARSLPNGFRSLMYCDALSCGEGMDMIRVQLPSVAMPRQTAGFVQTTGSVTADVIVGPDGIARGIRFEEIEF